MIAATHGRHTRNPGRRLRRAATAFIAAGALALTACSADAGAEGEEELTEMVAVTFLPLDSFTFTPEIFAAAGGYFEKHGLDVQLEPVQGSAAAVQSVIGGAADITRVSTLDVFPGLEQGQPLVTVGTMAYGSPIWILSADTNPIESAADMEGEVIGLGSIGGTSEKLLDLTLDNAGVARDSVTRQAVPVTGATFELVKRGQLTGYLVSLDTAIQIGAQNPDAVLSQAGLDATPDMHGWITTTDTLEDPERSENVKAFLSAIKEAMQFVIDDAENDYEEVLQILRDNEEFEIAALADEEVARQSLDGFLEVWEDPDGELGLLENDHEAWQRAYDIYVEGGMLEGGHDPQEWVTDELVPAG